MRDYNISVSYDDYFANANKIVSENIEVVGDAINFNTDKESLKILEDNNISYMLHKSKKDNMKKFVLNKSGMFIGVLFVMVLIVLNNYRVSKITFNGDYPINNQIEEYINGQTQDMLFFSFHKNNYNELSKNLRLAFNQYEWISIEKKGSILNVTVEPTTTKDITYDDLEIGDLIAEKDGMIESFVVFNGTSTIKEKLYVKKGDILIDGASRGVHAKGYVLATTYETIKIVVDKKETKEEYSGEKSQYYILDLFGMKMNIMKNNAYENSDIKESNYFSIPLIMKIIKIEEYEKNGIIYMYNKDSAKAYAKTVIEDDFLKTQVLKEEEIKRIEALTVKEVNDTFEVTFLVKKLESIGVFRKTI